MKKINNQAFTLVELLIVVAILAVLATVGFVSYSNYLTGVRDTNRVTQLVGIRNAIETFKTTKDTPLPEEKIDIEVNGELIAYQGIVGQNILNQIGLSDGGTDPKDETYFPYYLTKDRKYFQLMTFLEDEPDKEEELTFFPQTYASTDYSLRYPKVIGFPLGILTEKETNTPLHEIESLTGTLDVMTASGEYVAHIQDNNMVNGTGGKLLIGSVSTIVGTKYKSCKQILEKKPISSGVDGVYTINPTGTESFQVYCDMTTDGGGWTRVAKGREGWNWEEGGQGNKEDILNITSNEVHTMSSELISSILGKDWKDSSDGIRIFRESLNQERRWKTLESGNFSWERLSDSTVNQILNTIDYGSQPSKDNRSGVGTFSNDCTRIFLRDRSSHNYVKGWSTGASCCSGGWQYGSECHIIPFTLVYIRN